MELKIDPNEVKAAIETHIRAAIAKALTGDPKKLIETVVAAAMSQKRDSYSRETLFSEKVNTMIREAAAESFKAWLAEQKELIGAAVTKRLKAEENGFAETVADKIVSGLATSFYVSASLKVD